VDAKGALVSEAWGWLTDSANWHGEGGIPTRMYEHLEISAFALLLAFVIALPIGVILGHLGRGGFLDRSGAARHRSGRRLGPRA